MLDEQDYGVRDARGQWVPDDKPTINPIFLKKVSAKKWIDFLVGYFFPFNILFAVLGFASFYLLSPFKTVFSEISLLAFGALYLKNAAIIMLVYGYLEWRLYVTRRQQARFKYNAKFPGERASDKFAFRSQYLDNIFYTFSSGITIWSGYEYGILFCWANDIGFWTTLEHHPIALCVLALFIPLLHEFHFYCVHRILHTPFLYKYVHSVHHRAVNPSPLSSLSMHPIEHLLYWSDCLIHLVLPSHPLIALYHLQLTGTGALVGHIGFDRIEHGQHSMKTHAYAHYLHHKYFNVNYGDGAVPFDALFGTWHDGSDKKEQAHHNRKASS